MTAKEIAEKSGVRLWKVYYIANKLGKSSGELPSVDEIKAYSPNKRGRPNKRTARQK